jgi:hypothetical protein
MFEYCSELLDRNDDCLKFAPSSDISLQKRSRGTDYLEEVTKAEEERSRDANDYASKRSRIGESLVDEEVPAFLRDLLTKLPQHGGILPDIDSFVDQLRKTVLPPRPIPDEDIYGATNTALAGPRLDSKMATHIKSHVGYDEDDMENDYESIQEYADSEDVFKIRQKQKLIQ